ncbi:MAG: bifunctional DNA-formamidopyrimidine glycosylase/DNA-(apurinic or apyrimidinic site) lyase [Paracoccaceae bacterium]
MPELPEVETVLRGLAPVLEGRTIIKAKVNRPDLRWPFPENMAGRISGQKISKLWRRSKYILADLSSSESLLVHLGMSGRILISGDPLGTFVHDHPAAQKHDHVVFDIDNGARVTFNDPRRFGAMDLLSTDGADHHPLLRDIGPEPLSNAFNETYLIERLKGKKSAIKSVLLDQKIVAGLGNIYVCEALYRAGISPKRLAGKTAQKRLAALVPIIRQVLDEAINAGGSSLRDFRQADGELGYFQHSFNVYGREGLPCVTDGCDHVVQRIVQSGRSSFYCKNCQK